MKPIYGLILAIGLGLAGGLFNFAFLTMKSRDVEKVYFLGIRQKDDAGNTIHTPIGPDKALSADDLEQVGVPKLWMGNLEDYAFLASELNTVKGDHVWRTIPRGRLLMRDDVRTPPAELKLAEDEIAMGVPVGSRAFPLSLIKGGDQVSFYISRSLIAQPSVDGTGESGDGAFIDPTAPGGPVGDPPPLPAPTPATPPVGASRIIGPFSVISVGTRLSSVEVMRASKIPLTAQNSITVRVKRAADGSLLEEKARTLMDLVTSTDFRQLGVILHGQKKGE